MFHKKLLSAFIVLLSVSLFFTSCSQPDNPKTVAEKFWQIASSGNPAQAAEHATKSSRAALTEKMENADAPKGTYTLGEVKMEGEKATIATKAKDQSGMEFEFQTIVVREDGKWKVDFPATSITLLGGAMQGLMKGLEEAFKGIGNDMQKAFKEVEESVKQIEENVKEPKKEESAKTGS